MTASPNKIIIALLSDNDISTSFEIVSESFGNNAPFINTYFPGHNKASGRQQGSERLAGWRQHAKTSTFLKAVVQSGLESKEQVIGVAVWTYMNEAPPTDIGEIENTKEVWPDADDREFMARLWKEYVKPRTQAIEDSGGKGVYVLELLAVHPDYQGLGAGTALVKWGTNIADQQGYEAIVEGTPKGRLIYEKCGFCVHVEEMSFDTGLEFAERKKPILTFLKRQPEP